MRNSLFGLSVAPETRHEARRKSDMTYAHITDGIAACPRSAFGRFESFASGCNGSTLLKKSALVTTAGKLAFEI